MDRVYRDGIGRVGAAESIYRNLNCASLCLTVVASMAHMTWKGSNMKKGTEKWHKILTTSLKISTLPLKKCPILTPP